MAKFIDYVNTGLNNKEHVIATFCNLDEAVDPVDHKILLSKMSKFGVKGNNL